MASRLIIHFDGARAAWLDASDALAYGTLADAAAHAGGREATVLLPSEQILITDVRLPPIRQAGRRQAAARYALEDQLVARVETLHVALAARDHAGGTTAAAVIDSDGLRGYLAAFEEAGLNVVALCPDALALPAPADGQWQVALIGERVVARSAVQQGFACEASLWPALTQGLAPPPARIVVHAASDEQAANITAPAPADANDSPPEIEHRPHGDDDHVLAALLRQAAASAPPIDLRQGAFARASAMQKWWQPFKVTAALVATGLVLAIIARGVETWRLDQRIDALHATSLQAFHAAFPDVAQVNDLRVQAEQKIRALRGRGRAGGGAFSLLQALAEVIGAAHDLKIESLQYRDGTLYLSLRAKSVQALEALRAGFARQSGVRLTVDSADAASNGVQIRASVAGVRSS